MRNVYREYVEGQITWDEAYAIANNLAATASEDPESEQAEVDWYASQMESLAVDAAEHLMKLLGYRQDSIGVYSKP